MAKKSHSASGKVPENGLSSLETATETLKDLGMDSHGPNQVPMGIVKKKVSSPGEGSFQFR